MEKEVLSKLFLSFSFFFIFFFAFVVICFSKNSSRANISKYFSQHWAALLLSGESWCRQWGRTCDQFDLCCKSHSAEQVCSPKKLTHANMETALIGINADVSFKLMCIQFGMIHLHSIFNECLRCVTLCMSRIALNLMHADFNKRPQSIP